MSVFNLPPSNNIRAFAITEFGGVDFWNSPENVSKKRSSSCVNMIKDKNGSVRKRMGYKRILSENLGGKINGACFWNDGNLIHAGEKLYFILGEKTELIYSGLRDAKSVFIPWGGKVYIITGGGLYYVSKNRKVSLLSDDAYVPTVIISKTPTGGGTLHEEYNLLSKRWKEQFLADGESTVYKLEKKNISCVSGVWIRDENGDMNLVDASEYTVSLTDGTVTFLQPPCVPSVVGMDNLIIEVEKDEGNEEMLLGCTVGAIYGAGDLEERLFIGGNENHVGMDFFSASDDFSYFPHMNYSKLSESKILGYSVSNGVLYTHMEGDISSGEAKIIKRTAGTSVNGKTAFVISGEFYAPRMISCHTALSLNGEPLYLSEKGIYGITVSDVTDEKVCQLRSAYFGNVFSQLSLYDLENSHSVVFGDYYILSAGNKMFLLDGEAKSYFNGTPLCSYQYECYYFENIPAVTAWTDGDHLYIGSEDGMIYQFFSDVTSSASYADDGKAVRCYFETADMDGGVFFKKKTYVSVAAKIGAYLNTGIRIYASTDGKWHETPVYDSMGRGRYFDFKYIDFGSVSFSSNRSEVTLCGKVRIRNTDSVRFRLVNDKAEPFSLLSFGAEYVQKGNYIY